MMRQRGASFFLVSWSVLVFATLCCATSGHAVTPPQVSVLASLSDGLAAPLRMTQDAAGVIYVADPRSCAIQRYLPDGSAKGLLATPRTPFGLAVTPDGKLLVSQVDRVVIMDRDSGSELGHLGSGPGQFKKASGIALDSTGYIYVADSIGNEVQVFTPTGQFAFRFGTSGSGSGQFFLPTAIAFNNAEQLLAVTDTLNGRVQFFDTSGNYVRSLGSLGSGPLKFTSPQGISFEYTDSAKTTLKRIYVADAFQGSLQAIDPVNGGSYLSTIGGYGRGAGKLQVPGDVLFDQTTRRLMVADSTGSLVLFGIDGGSTPVPGGTAPDGILVPNASKISIQDALIALRMAVQLITPTVNDISHGDINKNGSIDIQDALMILRKVVGLPSF